jgi:hypothetical protein
MNPKGEFEHKRGRANRPCGHDQEGRARSLLNPTSINDTSSCNTSECLNGLLPSLYYTSTDYTSTLTFPSPSST